METGEREFRDVLYVLRYVLLGMRIPLSVSFLNATFASRFKRKFAITEDFMKVFKNEFIFLVIGDDIKIKLKNDSTQPINAEYQEKADEVKKILIKDSMQVNRIKKEMSASKSMLLEDFCKKFSSNKYKVSYPFINRNSNTFKLRAAGQETFVDLAEDDNIVISESEFWEIVDSEGLKKLVIGVLLNFFRKFNSALNQGQLQVCFNYGSILIDGAFMIENQQYFEKIASTEFRLKAEFRTLGKFLVTTTTPMPILGKGKKISRTPFTHSSTEAETQISIDEVTSTVKRIDTEIENPEIKNEGESSSDDESCGFTGSDFETSFSDSEDEDKNELSDFSEDAEEHIQEEKQNQSSDCEGSVNEITLKAANEFAVGNCPWKSGSNNGKGKIKKTEMEWNEMEITDRNDKPAAKKKVSKRKVSETEEMESAISSKRSFIFFAEDDLDPLLIGFGGSSHERRKKLEKVGHFVLKEICKE